MTTPLVAWKRPSNYIGADWNGWLVFFLSQNRDSDCLTRSNFQCAFERLKKHATDLESEDCQSVQIVSENHFLVGWVEWIAIHESNKPAIEEACAIYERFENHPVVNESHWSEMEFNEYLEAWKSYGHREFIRELERAELIEEGCLDDSAPDQTVELFEALIPSGEYHTDGAPNVDYAIQNAKRNGLPDAQLSALGLETSEA